MNSLSDVTYESVNRLNEPRVYRLSDWLDTNPEARAALEAYLESERLRSEWNALDRLKDDFEGAKLLYKEPDYSGMLKDRMTELEKELAAN